MSEQAIVLILGMSLVILSIIFVAVMIWLSSVLQEVEKSKHYPGAVNISDCDCKGVKSVEPDKRLPFNDWAKKYIRPFSNAKPKR